MPRVLVAVVLSFLVLAAPASASVPKGRRGAAFYKPPKHFAGPHGALIWARKQTGSDALQGARANELLLYRSRSLRGKTTAVSGSLALPKGKPPRGGWPVITYAHGTTGVADACTPTRGYDAGGLVSYAFPLLERWLKAGYAVVRTDYDGLGTPGMHQYLVGRSEARSVLDAVRAARAFDRRLSKRFVIAGHSQGGHAALFAAAAAPKWVPELRLRGTVALAPASHLRTQFQTALSLQSAAGGLGGIIALGLRAMDTVAPSLGLRSLFTPAAVALYPQTRTACLDRLSRPESFGGLPLNQIFRAGVDLEPLLRVLGKNDPEHLRMRTPVRIEQGTADGTAFPAFTDALVDEYKAHGVKVGYRTYAGVTHRGVVVAAAGDATRWITSRAPRGRGAARR